MGLLQQLLEMFAQRVEIYINVCLFWCVFTVTPTSMREDLVFSDLSVEVQALLSSYYKER